MIIELHNFGPIERFTFDTEKQMYFIFGENNLGKSYAISAVYLILKNWKKAKELRYSFDVSEWNYSEIKKKISLLESEVNLDDEFKSITKQFLYQYFIENLENSFSNSFSSIGDLFNKYSRKGFVIKIEDKNVLFTLIQKNNKLEQKDLVFKSKINLIQDEDYPQSYFTEGTGVFFQLEEDKSFHVGFFGIILDYILFKNKKTDFYFLPASRSGIYNGLSAFSAIIVQLTQLRNQIPNYKFEIPTLSEPNSDYFLNISTINGKGYSTPFSEFAKKIEDKIIKGKISFDKSDRKLYYEPEKLDLSLELSQASSMISEIAPIIAHLKFILNNAEGTENYLFIEEPEAHLHPKSQVELMKLFAELAGNGLHIIMTSHSNYLFNKLSNMVLAKEIDPETISVCLMKMGKDGSYVDENAMQIDEDGIDDDNFADIAEELYTERLKLYEQNP